MSYTNVELVRHHLVTAFPVQDRVFDQPLIIANDYVAFFSGPVDRSSVRVKSPQTATPTRIALTLTSATTSLSSLPLTRGSVVVASNSSLGHIYIENRDYVIDYDQADLTIKGGGDLSTGQSLTVWFRAYHLYCADSDYQLDAERGRIRRLAGGDIADGETVYVDYAPVYQSYNEDLLTKAVLEANGVIEKEVDPEREFGADPVLQAAATYRALEIVSRASAARELASLRSQDRTALAWVKLADTYASRSEQLLRSFRPPYQGPTPPAHS